MNNRLTVFGFSLVLLLTWFCYGASFGADFQLDDQSNLGGLAKITDLRSGAYFILAGDAGPTGRPLSLLSFALQADEWQLGAATFLRVNALIHIINALLLAASVFQLSRLRGATESNSLLLGCVVASLWVLLPLNATATVLVVQRMTTLSALFSLAGIALYLWARASLAAAPRRALILMGASVVAATCIGALAKETALLLPMLVLVLESTVLSRPSMLGETEWRRWTAVFLWLPSLLIVAYVLSRWNYPDYVIALREFDAGERLLTEAQILWLYVSKAVAGFPGRLGIYQGDPEIARSLLRPQVLLAVLAWLLAASAAVVWRRRFPLFGLAVLWFLAGHFIESTVIPLELYFEHRNYVPIIGPLIALCAFLLQHSVRIRRLATLLLPVLLLANGWFLYSFSSLWGDSSSASRYWAERYPGSVRAVTNLASYQLSEESVGRGLETLERFAGQQPRHAYLGIQTLNIHCMVTPSQPAATKVADLRRLLSDVSFTYTAVEMLSQLFATTSATECVDVPADVVTELAESLRQNPRYVNDPLYNQFHHKLLASISRRRGDTKATLEHLQQAIAWSSSSELNMMMTTTLAGSGDFDSAREFLASARERSPRNPIKAIAWRRDLDELANYVDALEADSRDNPPVIPGADENPGQT